MLTCHEGTEEEGGIEHYAFFNLGTRWDGWSTPRPSRFNPGKDPVPRVQAAGWAPAQINMYVYRE
jgi:hypothetical protein